MKRSVWLAGLLALTACSGASVPFTDRDLSEVVLTNPGADIVAPPLRYERIALRTYRTGPDGVQEEIAGARCTVTAAPYGAVVAATPVLLAVPILEPETPALVATCTAPELSGGTELPPQKGPFGIGYHGTIQVNMIGAG